jgi:hypothetical protein
MQPLRTLVVSWSLSTFLWAQAADRTEAAFDTDYGRVHQLMQQGKWNDAKSVLLALVDGHAGKVWVQAQCEAIAEDLGTCMFFASAKVPKLQDMVGGKIAAFDERSGRIKVTFDGELAGWRKTTTDADEADGGSTTARATGDLMLSPLVFAGPYTITLTAKAFPRNGHGVRVFFDLDPTGEGWFCAGFGYDLGRSYVPSYLQRQAEPEPRMLFQTQKILAEPGKPFRAVVKVGDANVETLLDNKPIGKASRDGAQFGQVMVEYAMQDEVTLEGKIEPSSLQSQVDEEVARQREKFAATFDAKKVLPAWVFDQPRIARVEAKTVSWLPGLGHQITPVLEAVIARVLEGKFAEADTARKKLTAQDASPLTCSFLEALLHVRLGRPDAAVRITSGLVTEAPQEAAVRLLHAEALGDTGRLTESLQVLRDALPVDPGWFPIHEQLCVTLLRRGAVEEAKRAVRDAKTRHGLWEEAAPLERILAMAERGPLWPRRFTHRSAHYEVVSDIDAKVCFQACQVLEQSYVNLMAQLTWIKEDKDQPRFRVFLFSGEDGYQAYNKAILGGAVPHTAGLYSPVLKQLLIWNVPRREDMVRTVRHEGFHQFLDRLMHEPPSWFNEGFAEFWETAQVQNGRLEGGQVRKDHIATLLRSRNALPKLREFVYGARADFYANAQQRYAQGWAMVHFLRKGPSANAARFAKLFAELRLPQSASAALDTAFAGVDWDKFEAEFWQHLQSLK